jgi:hypothetical protein
MIGFILAGPLDKLVSDPFLQNIILPGVLTAIIFWLIISHILKDKGYL